MVRFITAACRVYVYRTPFRVDTSARFSHAKEAVVSVKSSNDTAHVPWRSDSAPVTAPRVEGMVALRKTGLALVDVNKNVHITQGKDYVERWDKRGMHEASIYCDSYAGILE